MCSKVNDQQGVMYHWLVAELAELERVEIWSPFMHKKTHDVHTFGGLDCRNQSIQKPFDHS